MRRFEPVFIITAWSFVAQAIAQIKFRAPQLTAAVPQSRIAKFALPAAAFVIPILTWYSHCPTMPSAWMVYTEDTYPLLRIVQEHAAQDRVFVTPVMGSWLLAMNPQQPVFVDSRFDAYPKRFLKIVDQCLEAKPQTLDRLDRIGIQQIVVRDDMALAHLLMSTPSWELALDDGVASWWVRSADSSKLEEWGINSMELPPHIAKATAELRDVRAQHLRKVFGQLAGTDRNQIR
jgi:hypothetical protein